MLGMLIAYDADGNIIATLDHMVARNEAEEVIGLIDFGAHESSGGEHTEIWTVDGAKGSKVWPEWLGSRAHDFRVELSGPPGKKRAETLIHRQSGYRRERLAVERLIKDRVDQARGAAADIRDIVGGPDRPILLDENGRQLPKTPVTPGTPASLLGSVTSGRAGKPVPERGRS